MQKIRTYADAQTFLKEIAKTRRSLLAKGPKLERSRALLEALGNPQNTFPVIHIAGTSGKGSTATILAALLRSTGCSVGLMVSPHLLDIRERMQIDGRLVSKQRFVEALNLVMPALEKLERSPLGPPSYFEVLTAMGYVLFAQEQVDYAVIETGMGGAFDPTNVITRPDKIAVLTKIGLDHTHLLGKTTRKIAGEKVGIIQPENAVFSIQQSRHVEPVIVRACKKQGSSLTVVRPRRDIKNIEISQSGTNFDFSYPPPYEGTSFASERAEGGARGGLHDLRLSLVGSHQAENAGLALTVFRHVCKRDSLEWSEKKTRLTLSHLSFPGRLEVHSYPPPYEGGARGGSGGPQLVIDGAHNPQKMRSLIQTLMALWPNKKFVFLLAFSDHADHRAMLKIIIPHASLIIFPDFVVRGSEYPFRFYNPQKLSLIARDLGYHRTRIIKNDSKAALRYATEQSKNAPVVITGYLHFVSAMYPILPLS